MLDSLDAVDVGLGYNARISQVPIVVGRCGPTVLYRESKILEFCTRRLRVVNGHCANQQSSPFPSRARGLAASSNERPLLREA
jgi:hypothetical protein